MIVSSFDPQILLTQAEASAKAGDWPQVVQGVQRLLLGDQQHRAVTPQSLSETTLNAWVELGLSVLEWGDFQARWDIAKVILQFGQPAIVGLLDLLSDESVHPDAQWFAVRILGEAQTHAPSVVPIVVPTLLQVIQQSDSTELQMVTVNALAQMGPQVLPQIEPLLDHPSTKVLGVKILSQIRHSKTIQYLLTLAKDEDPQVRAIAVEALGSFHAPEIAQILQISLRDYASPVRATAIAALSFCFNDLPEVDWVAHITPLLADLDLDVCRQAAAVLGKLGTPAALDSLTKALQSPHVPELLAISIVRAIAYIDRPMALQELARVWETSALPITARLELCRVLGQLEQPDTKPMAISLLLHWLETDAHVMASPPLQQAIVLSSGQLGDTKALEPLIKQLANPEQRVRLHIVAALKQLACDQAHATLQSWQRLYPPTSPLGLGITIALQEW